MTCSVSCIAACLTSRFTAELGAVHHRLSHCADAGADYPRLGQRLLLIRRMTIVTLPIVRGAAPSNYSQQLMAGLLPLPGLKPLFPPKTHGVTPHASRSRRLRR